jgi:hypothetical protein
LAFPRAFFFLAASGSIFTLRLRAVVESVKQIVKGVLGRALVRELGLELVKAVTWPTARSDETKMAIKRTMFMSVRLE